MAAFTRSWCHHIPFGGGGGGSGDSEAEKIKGTWSRTGEVPAAYKQKQSYGQPFKIDTLTRAPRGDSTISARNYHHQRRRCNLTWASREAHRVQEI